MKVKEIEELPSNWTTMTLEEKDEWSRRYEVHVCGQQGCPCMTASYDELHEYERWWGRGQPWDVLHRHRVCCTFKEMLKENAAGEWRKHGWGLHYESNPTHGERDFADIRRETLGVPFPQGLGIDFTEERSGAYQFLVLNFKRC